MVQVFIRNVLLAPAMGAFFYDDQLAIRRGVETDGFLYRGDPVTPGFSKIRMPAEAVTIGLKLSDGTVHWGDMMSVQYSGAGGRDGVFQTQSIIEETRARVLPALVDKPVTAFPGSCQFLEDDLVGLPQAIRYGTSQALLAAAAHVNRRTMMEEVCAGFDLPVIDARVPVYSQSGDQRHLNVDKMILRGVDVLPHGLINSREKFGPRGETFREFVIWVRDRIIALGGEGYRPVLHFDVYSWIGLEFGLDAAAIASFIVEIAEQVAPFQLNIECPADFGSVNAQIDGYAAIVAELTRRGSTAHIVADEHCNTFDDISAFAQAKAAHLIQIKMPDVGSLVATVRAVIACKKAGVGAYLGGSCVETDLSARVSAHIAVATQADMMLAKPGMGVDEGLSITGNEQSRILAMLAASRGNAA